VYGYAMLSPDTWYYVVFSFLLDGDRTEISLFVDNTADGASYKNGYFLTDVSSYKSYLGARRTLDQSTYGDYYNGYIFEFHV
jgi:hypothetical protein